jgi:hypothetical protein
MKEGKMQKIYKYENSIVTVVMFETDISEKFKDCTENFLRKVLKERNNYGNSNTSRNFNEKQILHR